MSVDQMRCAIYECYKTPTWHQKVDKMADNQVIAIYKYFQKIGRIK